MSEIIEQGKKAVEFIHENGPYIMNTSIMVISIIASFLSAEKRLIVKVVGLSVLAISFNVLTGIVYRSTQISFATFVLSVIWVLVSILVAWNREIVSRKKIDKLIRKFTDNADTYKPICIFGGDLDFFGNVEAKIPLDKRIKNRNSVIFLNRQYKQIVKKGFKKVYVLHQKPDSESEKDKKTRIRLGFLKEQLKGNLEVKFFEEKECDGCPDRETCLACDVCSDCPENKSCKRRAVNICEKIKDGYQGRCYNPDTQLRGRIANRKSDGSTSVAIVTTYKPGKSYILKEYSSDTKECTIYQNIWNVWWKKCNKDDDFIKQCINEYHEFMKTANDKVKNKYLIHQDL